MNGGHAQEIKTIHLLNYLFIEEQRGGGIKGNLEGIEKTSNQKADRWILILH